MGAAMVAGMGTLKAVPLLSTSGLSARGPSQGCWVL